MQFSTQLSITVEKIDHQMSQLDALYGYIVGALHVQSLEGSNLTSHTILALLRGRPRLPRRCFGRPPLVNLCEQ